MYVYGNLNSCSRFFDYVEKLLVIDKIDIFWMYDYILSYIHPKNVDFINYL